jgi:hypothetical protein
MSIEILATLDAGLSDDAIARIKRHIEDHSTYRVVRDNPPEYGIGPISSQRMPRSLETITVSMQPHQVYVAFHASTRTEREAFICSIVDALAKEGIVCKFEEL